MRATHTTDERLLVVGVLMCTLAIIGGYYAGGATLTLVIIAGMLAIFLVGWLG